MNATAMFAGSGKSKARASVCVCVGNLVPFFGSTFILIRYVAYVGPVVISPYIPVDGASLLSED
jgi:hypothetical protein